MTTNTTYRFEKAFRKSVRSFREQYYDGEISREEYEDLVDRAEYARGEAVIEAMEEEMAV